MPLDPKYVHTEIMKKTKPEFRIKDYEDPLLWQMKSRDKLKFLLGLPLMSCDMNYREEYTSDENPGFTEKRFIFTSEPGVDVCCHALFPKNGKNIKPVMICLQGHSTGMHNSFGRPKYPEDEEFIKGRDGDYAVQAVKRGFIAIAMEQRGFGERGADDDGRSDCQLQSMQALMIGRTMIGERCWDVSRLIDVIMEKFPEADSEKICIMGQSGGGTTSIYASACDERIYACLSSCALSGFKESIGSIRHCVCNYVPDIIKYFDMADIAGLIAPRAFVSVSGEKDNIFPFYSAKEQAGIISKIYEKWGKPDKYKFVSAPEGHRFYSGISWDAFESIADL